MLIARSSGPAISEAMSEIFDVRLTEAAVDSTGKIHSIQFMRAFAALLVVFQHSIHEINEAIHDPGRSLTFAVSGIFGVKIFFVISGFIIYSLAEPHVSQPNYFWQFVVERLLRVVPLYWIATTLFLLAAFLFRSEVTRFTFDVPHIAASYALIPWPRPSDGQFSPVLALGWSLNYEIFFYLVFAACLMLRSRIIAVICPIVFAVIVQLNDFVRPHTAAAFLSLPIILLFPAGVMIAAIHGMWTKRLEMSPAMLTGVIAVVLLVQQIFLAHGGAIMGDVLSIGLVGLGAFVQIRNASSPWSRWLTAVGNASFSLYLFHIFAINAILKGVKELGLVPNTTAECLLAVCIAASLLLAFAMYRFVEIPIVKWTARLRYALFGFISKPSP